MRALLARASEPASVVNDGGGCARVGGEMLNVRRTGGLEACPSAPPSLRGAPARRAAAACVRGAESEAGGPAAAGRDPADDLPPCREKRHAQDLPRVCPGGPVPRAVSAVAGRVHEA
jgi:hypothetical protein